MTPLRAILRVTDDGTAQQVHLAVDPLLAPMAAALVDSARRQARAQLAAPGLYRLQVGGPPHAPDVRVERLGDAADSLVLAELQRGRDGALAIRDLVFSRGQGARVDARAFMDLLGQAIARQAAALDGQERATVEILVAAGS